MKYLVTKKKFKGVLRIVCNRKFGLNDRILKNLDEIYEKVFSKGFNGF
jgi:hypothetical protein